MAQAEVVDLQIAKQQRNLGHPKLAASKEAKIARLAKSLHEVQPISTAW